MQFQNSHDFFLSNDGSGKQKKSSCKVMLSLYLVSSHFFNLTKKGCMKLKEKESYFHGKFLSSSVNKNVIY